MLKHTSAPMCWWLEPSEAQQFLTRLRRNAQHPILATPHLRLRELSAVDVQHLAAIWHRAAPIDGQRFQAPPQAEGGIQLPPSTGMNDSALHWALCLLETDELIGHICLQNIDLDHSQAELRFWIEPRPDWGACAVEAGQAVLAYAFGSLSLVSLYAFSTCAQQATFNALGKIGLRALEHNSKARQSWDRCPEVQVWNVTRHRWLRNLRA